MRKSLLLLLFCALAASVATGRELPKLVMVGHLPKLAELRDDIDWYERQAPFDGVMLLVGMCDVFNPKPVTDWERQESIANAKIYREIKFKRWTYNFLGVLIDQHKPAWFDEGYWKVVCERRGYAARLAKRAGMVGICFDPEGYGVYPVESYFKPEWWIKGGGKPKGLDVQPPDPDHTEKDYLKIARKRGQQVGAAVFKEFPDIVWWSFYWWSFGKGRMMGAFCNGILDVIPPEARLIDGDEWSGYCAKDPAAYERMLERNKTGCGWLDKRNAVKHKKQGGFSPSFYMDAYVDPSSGCLTPNIQQVKNRADYFHENLKAALKTATGGHVWIYGEKRTWVNPPPKKVKKGAKVLPTWEEAIPGIRKALFGKRISEETKDKKEKK